MFNNFNLIILSLICIWSNLSAENENMLERYPAFYRLIGHQIRDIKRDMITLEDGSKWQATGNHLKHFKKGCFIVIGYKPSEFSAPDDPQDIGLTFSFALLTPESQTPCCISVKLLESGTGRFIKKFSIMSEDKEQARIRLSDGSKYEGFVNGKQFNINKFKRNDSILVSALLQHETAQRMTGLVLIDLDRLNDSGKDYLYLHINKHPSM